MGSEPCTPEGRRAWQLLQSLVGRADFNVNSVRRKFSSYSDVITNEDKFVKSLYQQGVLLTTVENLKETHRTKEARYEQGIEVACKKKAMKEIVVALEQTENGHIIERIPTDFGQQDTTDAQSPAGSGTDSLPPVAQGQVGFIIGGDATFHAPVNNNVGT